MVEKMILPPPDGPTPFGVDPAKKCVLFHRDFQAFTGGHLKVWDYFNHVASTLTHEPRIAFSAQSKWGSTNPWSKKRDFIVEWQPEKADVLFLAGMDWRALPESHRQDFGRPVINLIQHQRHAAEGNELRAFLKNRAVRICVSAEVANAIEATGEVDGPVFVIPNGVEVVATTSLKPWSERRVDVLICGLKAAELARSLQSAIASKGGRIECLVERIPREEYLARVGEAKIAVFLPRPVEGFYLPALEGMATGTVVVCPDCGGNRGFCKDLLNCFRPNYELAAITTATADALQQSEVARNEMLKNAAATVRQHSLAEERQIFLRILAKVDDLMKGASPVPSN